jgi:hypothetical protein
MRCLSSYFASTSEPRRFVFWQVMKWHARSADEHQSCSEPRLDVKVKELH